MNSPKWAIDPLFEQRTAEAQLFYVSVKKDFDFLRDNYVFKPEFEKTIENSDETAQIIFQSAQGRIQFSWNHSLGMYVSLALGPSAAVDRGAAVKKDWKSIQEVFKFLRIDFDWNLLRDLADRPLEEQISRWKALLAPHWNNIIALFAGLPIDQKAKTYLLFWNKIPF